MQDGTIFSYFSTLRTSSHLCTYLPGPIGGSLDFDAGTKLAEVESKRVTLPNQVRIQISRSRIEESHVCKVWFHKNTVASYPFFLSFSHPPHRPCRNAHCVGSRPNCTSLMDWNRCHVLESLLMVFLLPSTVLPVVVDHHDGRSGR